MDFIEQQTIIKHLLYGELGLTMSELSTGRYALSFKFKLKSTHPLQFEKPDGVLTFNAKSIQLRFYDNEWQVITRRHF